jgi:hypothetical protein
MKDIGVGAALGVLLGMLVGLSASEVVAGVVTGLVGLLGVLFGLRSENAAGPLPGGNGARVVGFALAMAVSLPLAVAIRAHGVLEPAPLARAEDWIAAGVPAAEAAELVVFERTGLLPKDRETGSATRLVSGTGALFSAESMAACDTLLGRRYESATALEGALAAEGGDWQRLAAAVPSGLDDAERLQQLQAAAEAACRER